MEENSDRKPVADNTGTAVALGSSLGMLFGITVLDNLALGMALGLAVGLTCAALADWRRQKAG